MTGTCSATAQRSCDGGSSGSSFAVAAFVTAAAVTIVLLPLIWRLAGSTLGWYLRQRTERQRQYLLTTTAADEKQFVEQQQQQKEAQAGSRDDEDEGWETVEAYGAASAGNGETGKAADWDGIVGFFHPFW